jgi:YVTN family beta-propeller protein
MEASTELLKKLGRDRYGRVLQEHGALLEAAFSEFRGQVIDTPGDAYFVAFKSASDAVFAAVQVQRSLNTHAWPNGVAPSVRIGIHTGEAAQRKERYLGLAVHRASRIGAAGHGGQVLISDATRALVEDELPAGVELRELGEHNLKDIDRPERLYQLRIPNLREQFPPLRTEASKTAFAGRERELAEVAEAAVRRRRVIGRRGVLTALLIAVGLACATAALLLTEGSSHSGRTEIAANSLGMFRTDGDQVATEIPLHAAPNGVAAGEGAVWVTNTGNDTVSRVDPVLDRAVGTIQVGSGPTAVAVGGGAVWVVNSLDGTLSWINPAANREVQRIRGVGSGPSAVAYGEHSVWVASANDGLLFRVNPKTGRVGKSIETGASAGDIAVGAGSVWVSNQASRTVVRVDAATNEVSGVISVGNGPTGVAFGAGSVWVANNLDGTLSRIDPATNGVTATIPVGGGPKGVTFADGAVWVSDEFGGVVLRIDARTEKVEERLRVGNRPAGLDVSKQRVWIAVQPSGETHRGGKLTVAGSGGAAGTGGTPFDSIDPAIASLATSWSVLIVTNDGLTGFERVGGSEGARVVPDLAVSLPVATAGGRTYTFRLRPGIRYSDGALVRPSDFR